MNLNLEFFYFGKNKEKSGFLLKLTKLFFKQSNKLTHYGLPTVRTTSWQVCDRWWAAESTAKVCCLTGGGLLQNICWNALPHVNCSDAEMILMIWKEKKSWNEESIDSNTHLRDTASSLHVLESWNETDCLNKDKKIKIQCYLCGQ